MEVRIACRCPGEHGEDVITFYDRLDFRRATTITKAIGFIENTDPATRPAEVLATLSEFYILYGVKEWTLVGPNKRALEVTTQNLRAQLLEHPDAGLLVETADSLYQEQVLLPLVARVSGSSQRSRTEPSTSPTPRSTRPKHPKQSKLSSISTTPTDGIETTSSPPDGAYSSSQSLELAG